MNKEKFRTVFLNWILYFGIIIFCFFCSEKINPKIFFFFNILPRIQQEYYISVTVSNLSGTGLVLQNNNTETLNINSNGVFTFSRGLKPSSTYSITVFTNPSSPTELCTVSNATGTILNSNISNIIVLCTTITAPSSLTYSSTNYILRQNATISSITPSITGSISSCTSSPSLPSGLSINNTTCVITGTPTIIQSLVNYSITANNSAGSSSTNINISVQTNIYRIFITSASYNGNLLATGGGANGVIAADNLCNADTNKPNTSNYKAMISEATNRTALPGLINWVLFPNTIYIRDSDSATIFTTNAASIFTFGTLTNSFGSGVAQEYWTGFQSAGTDWAVSTQRCTDWTSTAATARYGLSNVVNYDSVSFTTSSACTALKKLLCVEQ